MYLWIPIQTHIRSSSVLSVSPLWSCLTVRLSLFLEPSDFHISVPFAIFGFSFILGVLNLKKATIQICRDTQNKTFHPSAFAAFGLFYLNSLFVAGCVLWPRLKAETLAVPHLAVMACSLLRGTDRWEMWLNGVWCNLSVTLLPSGTIACCSRAMHIHQRKEREASASVLTLSRLKIKQQQVVETPQ